MTRLFKGRINRTTFLLGNILFAIPTIPFVLMGEPRLEQLAENDIAVLFILLLIGLIVIYNLAITVRRLHDVSLSGWLCPITFLPGVPVALLLIPGSHQTNKYGHPQRRRFDFSSLLTQNIVLFYSSNE